MARVKVGIELWSSSVVLHLHEGSKALALFEKFEASDSDEDFEEFANWVQDDVADELEFKLDSAVRST